MGTIARRILRFFDTCLCAAGHVVPLPERADDVEVGDGHEYQRQSVQKYGLIGGKGQSMD